MTEGRTLRCKHLENGLVLEFHDQSNRYYGDFHKVRVEIRTRLLLQIELFSAEADPLAALQRARKLFGAELVESRFLERMGVAGAEVEEVREAMIDSFLQSGLGYLQRPDYPRLLLHKRLAGHRQGPFPRLVPR
jgi:hypothetical protein